MARTEMLGDLQSLFGPNDTQAGDGVGRCFLSALITFSRQFGLFIIHEYNQYNQF